MAGWTSTRRTAAVTSACRPNFPGTTRRARGLGRRSPTSAFFSSRFYGTGDDFRVPQFADLPVAETQQAGQHLVRMLAEERSPDRLLPRRALEIKRRAGHQVTPYSGLIEFAEDRIGGGAARVFAQHLAKGLVRTPAHAGARECGLDLVEG